MQETITCLTATCNALQLAGRLESHLAGINAQAETIFDRLTSLMAAAEGITEQLKAIDQIEWVGHMNSIRERAKEIAFHELICNFPPQDISPVSCGFSQCARHW